MGNTIRPSGAGDISDTPVDPSGVGSTEQIDEPEDQAPVNLSEPAAEENSETPPAANFQSVLGEFGLGGQMRESEIRGMLPADGGAVPLSLFSDGVAQAKGAASSAIRIGLLPSQLDAAKIPTKLRDELMSQASKKSGPDLDAFLDMAEAAIKSKDPAGAVKSLVMQGRIDAYFESFNASYTVNGKEVKALPHFRMADGASGTPGSLVKSGTVQDNLNAFLAKNDKGHYNQAMKAAIHGAAYGRANSDQIKMVTDALIRSGEFDVAKKNHPGLSDSDTIRMMQWDHGVGIDCAGYVQQAFMQVQGGDRKHFGFQDFGGERLMDLKDNRHFKQIKPQEMQPGDLIALDAPPPETIGHTVLVRDQHEMSAAEVKANHVPKDWARPNDKLHIVQVDGSFGAHLNGDLNGGLTHRTWVYNETNGKWAEIKPTGTGGFEFNESSETGPYDHIMNGIFRPTGK